MARNSGGMSRYGAYAATRGATGNPDDAVYATTVRRSSAGPASSWAVDGSGEMSDRKDRLAPSTDRTR
jgi:hypothetical protein